jgi:hypothetical protein
MRDFSIDTSPSTTSRRALIALGTVFFLKKKSKTGSLSFEHTLEKLPVMGARMLSLKSRVAIGVNV